MPTNNPDLHDHTYQDFLRLLEEYGKSKKESLQLQKSMLKRRLRIMASAPLEKREPNMQKIHSTATNLRRELSNLNLLHAFPEREGCEIDIKNGLKKSLRMIDDLLCEIEGR